MLITRFDASATLDSIRHMRSVLTAERLGIRVRREVLDDLCLAVSELTTNAITNSSNPPNQVSMKVFAEGTMLHIELTDDGDQFKEFKQRWEEGRMAPMDPLSESGRGMWLIRNAIDRLTYEYDRTIGNGLNRWRLWRSMTDNAKPSILLVEDDEITRGLFVTTLSKMAQVSCATSLLEARQVLNETSFDLVIADYNLGDGNLSDLLEGFGAQNEQLDMPFIFVTGDKTGQARQIGLRYGIHSMLEKPVRPRELLERANEAISADHAQEARASRRLVGKMGPLIAKGEPGEIMGFRMAADAAVASTGGGDIFADLGQLGREAKKGLRFVLADCAGHGMPARLQASLLSGLMAGLSFGSDRGPGSFVEALSGLIYANPAAQELISTVLVVDFLSGHRLELATGGHPAPMIISSNGQMRPVRLQGSLPGLLQQPTIVPTTLELGAGDRLLMATDGFAPQSTNTLSGIPDAVAEVLKESPSLDIEETSGKLSETLRSVFGPYPMDDWTFVLIERDDFRPARL